MIFVKEEKRLNGFKYVRCVKAKDLYSRLGHRMPAHDFHCTDSPVPMNQSKIDAMQSMLEDYDRYMQDQLNKDTCENQNEPQGNDDSSQ